MGFANTLCRFKTRRYIYEVYVRKSKNKLVPVKEKHVSFNSKIVEKTYNGYNNSNIEDIWYTQNELYNIKINEYDDI
jgi:hypothetical protein